MFNISSLHKHIHVLFIALSTVKLHKKLSKVVLYLDAVFLILSVHSVNVFKSLEKPKTLKEENA